MGRYKRPVKHQEVCMECAKVFETANHSQRTCSHTCRMMRVRRRKLMGTEQRRKAVAK